jgi:dTDP-4-dehydrorhamnose reductase
MTHRKTLLITGSNGYLGQQLTPLAARNFEVYAGYNRHRPEIAGGKPVFLDVTDGEQVRRTVEELRPDAIIHTAALNPGQGDEAAMQRVNVDGSRHVAEVAAAINARLVHVSSDILHDGRHAPYVDDAPPSPLNGYGRSKAAAEAVVAAAAPQGAIVRTSLIYGLTVMDRGTAGFVRRLEQGESLVLFSDVLRQPIEVGTLAAALLKLVKLDYAGTLNVAGEQVVSREVFGRRMLGWWGIETGQRVTSGRAVDISAGIPTDLRLTIAKAEQVLQMRFPGVDEVLRSATGTHF